MFKNKKRDMAALLLTVSTLFTAGYTGREEAYGSGESLETVFIETEGKTPNVRITDIASRTAMCNLITVTDSSLKAVAEEEERQWEEAKKREEEQKRKASEGVRRLMASIIFCEAGNQSYEGQVAVGAVVMNRVADSSYPDNIEAVIYQKGQFAPVATGWLDRVRRSDGYTASAMRAAEDALNGVDPVEGCLYFDRGGSGRKIGDHYFH